MHIVYEADAHRVCALTRRAFLAGMPCFAMAACSKTDTDSQAQSADASSSGLSSLVIHDEDMEFSELGSSDTLQYVSDRIYSATETALDSENYKTQSVQAVYVSREYLDELAYNSKANVYFGYTLDDLQAQFQGTTYVFTAEDGKTQVTAFEEPDTTFNDVTRNVAIGAGVILVCATISIGAGAVASAAVGSATAAATANTVSTVFAVSAESATVCALQSAAMGGLAAGLAKGFTTGDVEAALKEAAVAGSDAFKWGAFGGAIAGGLSEIVNLKNTVRTWRQSEDYAQGLLGGEAQKAYLNGEEVPWGTSGSTRPDIIRWIKGKLEAIEVKNYDLQSEASVKELKSVLKQEITARTIHLPEGSTQRVVLDIGGRGYSNELVSAVINDLTELLQPIDPTIIIEAVA